VHVVLDGSPPFVSAVFGVIWIRVPPTPSVVVTVV
jgi:hypothetical protein